MMSVARQLEVQPAERIPRIVSVFEQGLLVGQERQSPDSFGQRTPSKFSVFLVQDNWRGIGDEADIDMDTDRLTLGLAGLGMRRRS